MGTNKTITTKHSPVDKPHDKLIRRLLSNLTTAREILDVYLPNHVKELVDLSTLKQEPDTFVDAQHRFLEVDILFKAKCRLADKECYIWVLIEQQREPDVWLPLRQFCYLGVIWDHIRKASKTRAKSAKLPLIYPLVISNSSKPYPHSLTLRDMIEPDEAKTLFDDLFKTPSQLIDLAAIPDETLRVQLQGKIQAQALLLSLKNVFNNDLQEYLETSLIAVFQTLDQQGYSDEVANLLYYIYNEGNLNDSSKFWSFLHRKFSKDVEEKVMTLGQQARQQAERQALQQTALRMLDEKLDIKLISKVTKLSPVEIENLRKKKN